MTISRCVVASTAACLAVALMWNGPVQAQGRGGRGGAAGPPPVRIRVQVTQVKPDQAAAFQNVIRTEIVPALKKAGQPWQWMFTTGAVGQAATFVTVRPIANLAEFDQPGNLGKALGTDGAARVVAKITPTIVSQTSWVQTLNQNASIQSNSPTPPVLVLVQDFNVIPGKNAEFGNIMTMEFLPAMRKAGVKDFWVYTANLGDAPGGRVSVARPIANYAELDPQPGGGLLVRGGLTAEQAQQLNGRRNALVSSTQTNVYRYVPDLSYGMPAPAK